MKKVRILFKPLCIFMGAAGLLSLGNAAPLSLVQYPAGSATRQPAPNIIVSVDDSGSMGAAGIATLKDALKETFQASNLPDDQVRLAWQSMNGCNGIPSNSLACSGKNALRSFSGAHRANFLAWVETLVPLGGTPSHQMTRNAGDYLMRTDLGVNSPWASTPGTTTNPVLACRKSYNIFMTDGGWNSSTSTVAGHIDGDRNAAAYRVVGGGNVDGTNRTLGDGVTTYTANSNQTKVFSDTWGYNTYTTGAGNNLVTEFGLNTLSDLSFYYWATDLQPSIPNEVIPTIKKSGNEVFGTGVNAKTIPEFWNPRNDPATWQHMVTYSIGFGAAANVWTGSPVWGGDTFSGEFGELVQGTKTWPSPLCLANNTGRGNDACDTATGYSVRDNERRVELWHMAINGRGKFIKAPNAQALVDGFKDIVSTIVADNATPISGFTSASASVARAGTEQYASGYVAEGWSGYVNSAKLASLTGAATPNPDWGIKTGAAAPNNFITSADKLDALTATNITNRLILTTNDATSTGVSFDWATDNSLLSATQKAFLNADSKGRDRLNFIRGDRTKEGSSTDAPFRVRTSRQGDIVNSALWYVGSPASNFSFDNYRTYSLLHKDRLPMIYVGGNDGMLHGFSAKDGSEKIAYVPKGVIANLPKLSESGYVHRYYVDGSPFTGDVNIGTSSVDWRTMLIGSLGAGGKGYFVLDVTKPGTTLSTGGVATNFVKINASSLVVMDKTAISGDPTTGDAADIGHIMAQPVVDDTNPQKVTQVTRMNNGRWAVVMGNGYNSTNERPVLLIQYLDGDKALKKITAASTGTNAVENGLSAPRLVDIDGNGQPDVVYAGDLKGNLWKFDVSSANDSNWNTSFSSTPLYTAVYTSGGSSSTQPITAPPVVRPNTRGAGGLMVAFGTGRNITEGDRTDTSKQSVYSILDNTRYKLVSGKVVIDTSTVTPQAVGTGFTKLVEQTVTTGTGTTGAGDSLGRTFWTVSQNNVDYVGTGTPPTGGKKGWYLHLPETGERILDPVAFYDGSNNLEIISEVPGSGGSISEERCAPDAKLPKKFRTFLNILDGKKPSVQIIDTNGDGVYSASADGGASRMTASNKEARVIGSKTNKRIGAGGGGGGGGSNSPTADDIDDLAKLPELPVRPSWRQLQ